MEYLYETHIHTREGSACGVSKGREYIQRYLDMGYTGIIVTDHFFRGNCRADRNHPWKKWVQEFCRGYEVARDEGIRRGLDVFFGWEETVDGNDYLVYGLDKEWLFEHPEAAEWTRKKQFTEVGRNGGCVVLAHPFRFVNSLKRFPASSEYVDAIEAANAGNDQISDAIALAYARELDVPVTAGSDIHYAGDIAPETVLGVYLSKKMETVKDYAAAVRNNTISGLRIPYDRFAMP